jgi:hypothetical protein
MVDRIARAAIVESALDDQGIATIARACGTHRGAFLLHALQQGRWASVQHLAAICTRPQNFGASSLADVPLVAAAEAGATPVLAALVAAGAKPNIQLRGHGYPLRKAVVCPSLAPLPRSQLVHELLRLGAVPELRDSKGRDAYALAEAQGNVEVIDVLRRHGLAYGPRQSREARALGVRDICLLYDKADGLIYRIGQPDVPFLEGGDYDGPGPCPNESFRVQFERVRHRRSEASLAWFEPFLDRIERGQEFGYQELIASAPDLRIVRFDQTSNWSQMVD